MTCNSNFCFCWERHTPFLCKKELRHDHECDQYSVHVKDRLEAHLHWQKPKSKKPGFFVVPFTLPEKPITFGFFGTKSARAKKPESHTDVLVSGAHARLLSTFDRTRVVCITSRATVGWFRWRSRTTWPKTRIIPCEIGAGVYIGKKTLKNPRSFKKSHSGGGFFDSGFLQCLGVVA